MTQSPKIISLSLHDEVRERLRQRILARELSPGERIDETALVSEFGISRTPLREALKVLQAEGLVHLIPRRGAFVAELTEYDLDDIYATVALLEAEAAGKAAVLATTPDIEEITRLHERMELAAAAGDYELYRSENRALHEYVQNVAGNRWQKDILMNLRRVLWLAHHITIWLPERLQESIEEHRALLKAFIAADQVAASNIMRTHVMNQREALRREHAQLLPVHSKVATK